MDKSDNNRMSQEMYGRDFDDLTDLEKREVGGAQHASIL